MTALGSYYHDFPRLAQQSGYFFQLYRGKVNWTEIETLNIEEVIENRNFQLLEHNLVNVINCNLEREYDLKILDQKFVKLFKLAQLGVDYLSYCEMYLDRCVVLLQEQLIALREEYDDLKKDNQKKSEEIKKIRKKNRSNNYQCKKCEKIFISEVYLNHHEKRRHSVPNTPKSFGRVLSQSIDSSQQTDDNRKITSSTQTSENEKISETENIQKIKKENNEKIEHLQRELEDLKNRLKKTENTLTEKAEAIDTNHQPYLNYPGPVFYPPILPYVPPYLAPSPSFYDISPCHPQIISDNRPSVPSTVTETGSVEICQTKTPSEAFEEKSDQKSANRILKAKEVQTRFTPDVEKKVEEQETEKHLQYSDKENEKENINPQEQTSCLSREMVKPLPFPRRRRKMLQNLKEKDEQTFVESFIQPISKPINREPDVAVFSNYPITLSSTPLKETIENSDEIEEKENLVTKLNEKETCSNESINSREMVSVLRKKKSFIKKFVPRNSHKLPNFSKSLKSSLTNLYDSVSNSSKDSSKIRESKEVITNPADVLNNQLKQLGVDPEWTGIPKKTLKQKLKALRYRRKHLTEENPMFPAVRKDIEKSIFRKLKYHSKKKGISVKTTNEYECNETQASSRISSATNLEEPKPTTAAQKPIMYNVETDSETESSDLEPPINVQEKKESLLPTTAFRDSESDLEENVKILNPQVKPKKVENEFDLSVFQVKTGNEKNLEKVEEKKKVELFVDEFQTDSDFDTDFLDDLEEAQRKLTMGSADKYKNDEKGNTIQILGSGKDLMENQSILKSSSNMQLNNKKKVLFVDCVENLQGQPKEGDSTNDDLWSLKSD